MTDQYDLILCVYRASADDAKVTIEITAGQNDKKAEKTTRSDDEPAP
jgi:hypothetical protein